MFNWLRPKKWAIHNPLKGWTLPQLTTAEARLIVSTLTTAEQKVTLVFCTGWDQWRNFEHSDCDGIRQVFAIKLDLLKVPLPTETVHNDEITTVAPLLAKRPSLAADRKSDRLEHRLPLSIFIGDHRLETHTVDLSAGGFRLEDTLPEWVAGYFNVLVVTPTGSFDLICNIVDSSEYRHSRVEISMDPNDVQWIQYQNWLSTFSQKSTFVKKS